jgi:hypothetical protein
LLDDLKQHKLVLGSNHFGKDGNQLERKSSSSSFKKHLDEKDVILASPKLSGSNSGRFPVFEIEGTIAVAWDCLVSLLKKAEGNQLSFRSANGLTAALPFLASDIHRSGVLRVLTIIITEDSSQAHSEELGALVEISKSGMVTSALESQRRLNYDAKCDIFGAMWRILGGNSSAQRVFGETNGFSLLLTTLHGFLSDENHTNPASFAVCLKLFTFLLRLTTVGVRDNAVNRIKLHSVISSQTFYDLLSESGLICADCERHVIRLLLELALEIVIPPSPNIIQNDSTSFLPTTRSSASFVPERERVYNASAIRVLLRLLLFFTPKVQLELLNLIVDLARTRPFNQENLTSAGCVELLLEIIQPLLSSPSPLFSQSLKLVEVLGAYRLSPSELRVLVRYMLQTRLMKSGDILVEMMRRLVLMEDPSSESISLAPFVEMDMSKTGHACINISLGERSWPPAAGYSFICWFQYRNLLKTQTNINQKRQILRIFSVGTVENDNNTFYAELSLQDNGILTLATSSSSLLSISDLEMEEDRWHHLAVVHSKPNALAGLFQGSVAYIYLNGKLKHTGKLGYSASPVGKSLQVTIGIPAHFSRVSELTWKLRSCCLFEEVLTPGSICFMYILGRGYRGLFQDTDLLRFVPNHACSGVSMAILDSLETDLPLASNAQKQEAATKLGITKNDVSGIVWDLERLGNLSLQLSGKKLIFAFDGTCTEAFQDSGTSSMVNLVDPLSAAASPIGGIPRFGRLNGNIYVCKQCVIGDVICPIGGIAVILALVEASETSKMLHMSLMLLASSLNQNPQNLQDMQTCRGYHLLALFLHRRMSLFDMESLEIFFQIAACEASFAEPKKTEKIRTAPPPYAVQESSFENLNSLHFRNEFSSAREMDDYLPQKDSFSQVSELDSAAYLSTETSSCMVLSNADMVEHVLLDWTLWVNASVSIQISLLGFLEHLVSMHWYRNHNLTILRRINLVQHLLVTMQRGDVEIAVLEKLVVLLGVILEDGFIASELENVVKFVIMTFDPPELKSHNRTERESMGKHVIVRNMLLEMLIDLQVTIRSEELLEQWHKIVSSKLITYFLDESVHPTCMRWVMTLLGACVASSSTFALKFRTSGGYQGLRRLLSSFYDSPDIYYILFCLILGKPVYPRLPEVRMIDFHALMPSNGKYGELRFVELLDAIIAMVKSTFDKLYTQSTLAHSTGNVPQNVVELDTEVAGELQGEALMHKTYAARLMGGEASAPAAATSVLRFMVDLAKMCPSFSSVCRRAEFLESCIELYFSCVRAAHAVNMAKELSVKMEHNEDEHYIKTSVSTGSFPQGQVSTDSDDIPVTMNNSTGANTEETSKSDKEHVKADPSLESEVVDQVLTSTSETNEFSTSDSKSSSSLSISIPQRQFEMPPQIQPSPSLSAVGALTSWLGAPTPTGSKSGSIIASSTSESSHSLIKSSPSLDLKYVVTTELLLEADESGYGGGPCSAAATAVLDLIAEVLSEFVTEQMKAVPVIESILESVPLYVDVESVLVFQGLCLSRLMNFLERRLLRDDEENNKRLEKSRWSLNLDALSWMIVDRVYMGGFPKPSTALRTLEFLFSMLQLANKDGRLEEATPTGKGLLYIGRGTKQLDAYVHSLLKNMNRMISYCFLPSFLTTIGENAPLSLLGLEAESKKGSPKYLSEEDASVNICTVLQLLVAHKRLIFSPSNIDNDLNCCLCVNLIHLLYDTRQNAQEIAIDILKFFLVRRKPQLEDLLISKPNQGEFLDVLHNGLDKILTESLSSFYKWLHSSEKVIKKVLEKYSSVMWVQYINGSSKFPGVRIKGVDSRRKREMSRKSKDATKLDVRHWEQVNERRTALELVREAMATELRVVRQDKYGWVLHAESEWQSHLEQLVHERGIFPMRKSSFSDDPEWQLCPIEGPYRTRKKLERSKLKIESIQNILDGKVQFTEVVQLSNSKSENEFSASDPESESFFNTLTDNNTKDESVDDDLYDDRIFRESDDVTRDVGSCRTEWNDDESLHSAAESILRSSVQGNSLSSLKTDEAKVVEEKWDKELNDNGEFLIRPYLEPLEKIKYRYNSERVLGLDKHDGIFLIGELCLYVIENFYIDESGCICEKESEDDLSVIDQALGVTRDFSYSADSKSLGTIVKSYAGGRAWAYTGGAWGKEKVRSTGNIPHNWRMWKFNSVLEVLRRDYQLRPVAVEIFSMDGCNDLLVFHKKEREEVFRILTAMNLSRNSMLDTTISGSAKQESNEGGRIFKMMAKSFSKRWQNGEISNFHYLMHLNTLAGRGYSDLTQYPVFPWVLSDYKSEKLDLSDPKSFRRLDKPMGCQTSEGESDFKKRFDSWEDPEIPKFHYGSHYSSAGIVLFYLLRLPPFSMENQKLQGGQFDHADRLFNNLRDTWSSAAGKVNTSDVKELIPEFFYMPEFLENRFNLDLGEKQSGDKVGDVVLPPWAKGSTREFIRKHREALESDYVSENLHHWIDLIFGYKQRGKMAEEATNVFYHYTYEGSVDIDSVSDPAMKAAILAQINHFGQTPKQLFLKPHVKRRSDKKILPHPLKYSKLLFPHEIRRVSSSISQIVTSNDKILIAGPENFLKPRTYTEYVAWGFPDLSLRFMSNDQDRLITMHENLHGGNQIQCATVSQDGQILLTGADDGLVCAWRITQEGPRQHLELEKALCAHTAKITCLKVSQPYMMIVSGSLDCTVIIWDLSSFVFVRQLSEFPSPVSAIYVNDMTGEIITAAGAMFSVWTVNGDCLAVVNASQLPSDSILSVASCASSDWLDTNWYVSGHQSGVIKVWKMVHCKDDEGENIKGANTTGVLGSNVKALEYRLILHKSLRFHKDPVTALHLTNDLKQLLSGDAGGHLYSCSVPDDTLKASINRG